MASTIHTMVILFKQMGFWDDAGSTVAPELLPGAGGSWVVAGTCLFWKFPMVVEVGSEPFPCCVSLTEVLLEKCSPYAVAVAFPNGSVLLL